MSTNKKEPDWKESNRPRPASAISDTETVHEYILRLFDEEKLVYKDGKVFVAFDFRGKGRYIQPKYRGVKSNKGYTQHFIRFNGSRYSTSEHRLVYAYFNRITEYPKGLVINHKDGDKRNNSIENLELVTQKDNINHAIETGLMDVYANSSYKLTQEIADQIRKDHIEKKRPYRLLASDYNVSLDTIACVCQNRRWVRS